MSLRKKKALYRQRRAEVPDHTTPEVINQIMNFYEAGNRASAIAAMLNLTEFKVNQVIYNQVMKRTDPTPEWEKQWLRKKPNLMELKQKQK
jgi:hypothetical protein